MELLRQYWVWPVLAALVGLGCYFGVKDARRARADRRSVVDGREIMYGPGGSYGPRSALWSGLGLAWLGSLLAGALFLADLFPGRWRAAAVAGILIAALLCYLAALRSLLDQVGTDVVEGRVLERKIIYSGEDRDISNYWIAVDDGRSGTVAVTPVGPNDYARVVRDALVRLYVTPRGRQLKRLDILGLPAPVNHFPGELAHLFPRGTADLLISPTQAARALGSPVEIAAVAPEVPNTRSYTYVPPGRKVITGTATTPALHVTEAFDPPAANEVARRATDGRRRTWHHGNRGVFQTGSTFLLTWGNGALMIRGQVADAQVGDVGRLAHSLKPPGR